MKNVGIALLGVAKAAVTLSALIMLLPAAWLFVAYNGKYRVCVPLENGLYLGYEAVFDLSTSYLKPIAVPKFPDGTPLIHDETWEIFVTPTSVYGLALGPSYRQEYRFAWRADTGLVQRKYDQAKYDALIAAAGHANWDIEADSVSTGWLLNDLLRRQKPVRERCPTALVTW